MKELIDKSESINELTKSLVQFKKELPPIDLNSTVKVKTKTGGEYTFMYADFPHIKNICDPVLSKYGLFVSQMPVGDGFLHTILMHESGQYISATTSIGSVTNKNSQEYGSLITYFKRYSYCAILGITADSDDDANASDGNTVTYVIPKKIIDKIAAAGTQEELANIWNENKSMQTNNEFIKLIKEKKSLL